MYCRKVEKAYSNKIGSLSGAAARTGNLIKKRKEKSINMERVSCRNKQREEQ